MIDKIDNAHEGTSNSLDKYIEKLTKKFKTDATKLSTDGKIDKK